MIDPSTKLQMLVLFILQRKLPIDYLQEKGYSTGQIMRALDEVNALGYVQLDGNVTVLSDSGNKLLDKIFISEPKGQWLVAQNDERIDSIGVDEIFLPKPTKRLFK